VHDVRELDSLGRDGDTNLFLGFTDEGFDY